jgi:phosphoenolpyruvate-protein phosphotransferase (PTS system enzyme I)
MSFTVHGLAVSRGIAIGRAVIVASSRVDVAHYFVRTEQVEAEIERLRSARKSVMEEIVKVQRSLGELGPNDAHPELSALLDVHLMLLQDEQLTSGVKHWISERRIQRRMGAHRTAGSAGSTVRRDGRRLSARTQSRR